MNNENPNPKHKELLDVLPESLHGIVIPVLKQWDQRVNEQFANIRSEYDDLKAFEPFLKNNIDPEYIEQAVILANQLQSDPKSTIDQINQAWNLGYVPKDEVEKLKQQAGSDDTEFELDGVTDITQHPQYKQLADTVTQLQQQFEQQTSQATEEQELAEFEAFMDGLEKECQENNKPFNRKFVTALIAEGIEPEDAVQQFAEVIAGSITVDTNTITEQPSGSSDAPVVLGGNGSGSGMGETPVDFGSMAKNNLNDTVAQLLQQAAESGQ